MFASVKLPRKILTFWFFSFIMFLGHIDQGEGWHFASRSTITATNFGRNQDTTIHNDNNNNIIIQHFIINYDHISKSFVGATLSLAFGKS